MSKVEYSAAWTKIDTLFNHNFQGEDWEDQQKYLAKLINQEFGISRNKIKKIFDEFLNIFIDNGKISLNWKNYQLPTLISITAKYL